MVLRGVSTLFFPEECVSCGGLGYCCRSCQQVLKDEMTFRTDSFIKRDLEGKCKKLGLLEVEIHTVVVGGAFIPYSCLHKLILSLKRRMRASLVQAMPWDVIPTMRQGALVPVPSNDEAVERRGGSIPISCAVELQQRWGYPLELGLLVRKGNDQLKYVKGHKRLQLALTQFIAKKDVMTPNHIILVDDVYTTGSTIVSCIVALQAVGYTHFSVFLLAATPYYATPDSH